MCNNVMCSSPYQAKITQVIINLIAIMRYLNVPNNSRLVVSVPWPSPLIHYSMNSQQGGVEIKCLLRTVSINLQQGGGLEIKCLCRMAVTHLNNYLHPKFPCNGKCYHYSCIEFCTVFYKTCHHINI